MYARIRIICILLALPFIANAIDVHKFTFSHIGIQEGIQNQRVYSLHETSDGAVWWTTRLGVDRSNGVVISNYLIANSEFGSIGGKTIRFASYTSKSLQDSVFIFDNQGKVYRYDNIQNRFDCRYDIAKYMGINIVVEDVMVSDKGMLFAMREGLYWVKNDSPKPVAIDRGNYYNAIFPVKGHLAGTAKSWDKFGNDKDYDILLARNKCLVKFCVGIPVFLQPLLYENVCSVHYDNITGMLWAGTLDNGVKVCHPSKQTGKRDDAFTQQWQNVTGVPHNPVRKIVPYDAHTLLFGIDGHGVYQYKLSGSKSEIQSSSSAFVLFNANDGQYGVLAGNGVYDILLDAWGNIVIGTYSGGIDIARPIGSTAEVLSHSANNPQCLGNNHVNCVLQQDAAHLLMGTDDGLSIYDTKTGTWRSVAHGMVVLDICKKNDGGLLIATYGNGVCEVGSDGSAHPVYSKANGILKDDHVYELLYDRKGNLWIGTLSGSLAVKTNTGFRYYNLDNVGTIRELHDGRIAVGTAHGLYIININDTRVHEQKYSVAGTDFVNKYVLDLYEDNHQNLWIATDGGGVYIYSLKSGKCRQLTMKNGLPSNNISSIAKDKSGHIWLGTSRGLAFVNPSQSDKVFDVNYYNGLRTEYTRSAACALSDGHILLGTIDGARIIDPQHLSRLDYKAKLHILRIIDTGVKDENIEEFNEEVASMLAKGKLNLSYSQRTFELHFESINMRYNYDIAYQYRIGDGEWSSLSEESFIRFVNLEPGRHILYIRCVSKAGGVVLDEQEIKITIGQPWWNSWWMWCVYLVLLTLAFYGAWRVYDLQSRYSRLIMDRINDNESNSVSTAPVLESKEDDTDKENKDDADESAEFVNKATKIVLDNLQDSSFTIDTLCREIGMSRTLFYVKVKSFTGKSPQDFVRMIRLEKAASLIRRGRSVTDVAAVTGFENPKYFSIVFKKYFGVSPSKYNA